MATEGPTGRGSGIGAKLDERKKEILDPAGTTTAQYHSVDLLESQLSTTVTQPLAKRDQTGTIVYSTWSSWVSVAAAASW